MTIDEALKLCECGRKFTDGEYEQLEEWLKEMKKLRQCTNIENREYPYFNGFKEGNMISNI